MQDFEIEHVGWRDSCGLESIDAEKAYQEVGALKERTDDAVIKIAKNKRSAIHNAFEWDDSAAAHEHRRTQARHLLRSFTVTYKNNPEETVRAYEVTRKASRKSTTRTIYGTHEDAMKDPQARESLIAEAISQLMAWRRRFKSLNEFDRVLGVIDEVVEVFANK